MQEIRFPFFKKDRILKIEMLENMRDFPRDVFDIYSENLTDGIVCGLTPKVDKDIITFSKGIVKHNGFIYVLSKPTSIVYKETDDQIAIKLNFYDEIQDNDYKTQYIEIETDRNMTILGNQMELGRFKLKKGAYLRSNYKDMYDFTTEYNTINIVNVPYAGYDEPTISNVILKYFAKAVMATCTKNQMDIIFSMMCLNSIRVERQVICSYISHKQDGDSNSLTNMEIHERLVKILESIKKESVDPKRRKMENQKILVD